MAFSPIEEAVARLEDHEIRARVRRGDYSDMRDLTLTDDQRRALVHMADPDEDDVVGFAMSVFPSLFPASDPMKGITSGGKLSKAEAVGDLT